MATQTYSLVAIRPEFQVNNTTHGDQRLPDVVGLPDGSFAVSYVLDYGAMVGLQIHGSETYFTGTQPGGSTSIYLRPDGGFTVGWQETASGEEGIRWEEAGFSGQPLGDISLDGAGLSDPRFAANGEGSVLVYKDAGHNVVFWYVDSNTSIATQANAGGGIVAITPEVATLADGGFVVVWSQSSPSTNNIVCARIFNSDGTPRTASGLPIAFAVDADASTHHPAVAAMSNGNFAVAYVDWGWAGENGTSAISLAVWRADGTRVREVQVSLPSPGTFEGTPDITILANDFIVVSWGTTTLRAYYRVFDAEGLPVVLDGSEADPTFGTTAFEGEAAAIAGLGGGRFIGVWADPQNEAPGYTDSRIAGAVTEVVRNLTASSSDVTLTGDALRDIITGNTLNNRIDGKGGTDEMRGRGGSDTYFVDNAGDMIIEAATEGTNDWVATAVSYTLNAGAQVESFTTLSSGGTQVIHLTSNGFGQTIEGNAAGQTITGNGGQDWLIGHRGRDTLWGGAQNDRFIFNATTDSGSAIASADRIMDFRDTGGEQDLIDLRPIDANAATAGDNQFVLDTNGSFSTAEIRQTLINGGADLLVELNNDADAISEMAIVLIGRTSLLNTADFLM